MTEELGRELSKDERLTQGAVRKADRRTRRFRKPTPKFIAAEPDDPHANFWLAKEGRKYTRCHKCGKPVIVYDSGGALDVYLCEHCQEMLDSQRDEDGLSFVGPDGQPWEIGRDRPTIYIKDPITGKRKPVRLHNIGSRRIWKIPKKPRRDLKAENRAAVKELIDQ